MIRTSAPPQNNSKGWDEEWMMNAVPKRIRTHKTNNGREDRGASGAPGPRRDKHRQPH